MVDTQSTNMQTNEKQPNPDDSKGIKYGCIIFCLLSAFMIGFSNAILAEERMVNDTIDRVEQVQKFKEDLVAHQEMFWSRRKA